MKSAKDNFSGFFSLLINAFKRDGGPSSPAQWHTQLRPGYSLQVRPRKAKRTSGFPLLSMAVSYKFFLLFIILGLIFSCSKKNSAPEGILSKDEMAKVLTEFHLKESKIGLLGISQDSSQKLFEYYKLKYAGENNIPDSVLENSYQYYLANTAELSEIYDRVIDTLALREQRPDASVK